MTSQKTWSSVIALILTVVMVGGGIYFWQNAESAQKTGSLSDCSTLGSLWTRFSDDETSLSFCYKTSWGIPDIHETDISSEARIGSIYYIRFFTQSVFNLPLISYSTPDFQKTGDSDVGPGLDWEALDFNKNKSELAKLFPNEKVIVQKLMVNERQVLKVNRDFETMEGSTSKVDYFIPSFIINEALYNLHIAGSPEQEDDLDKLLESVQSITRADEVSENGDVVASDPLSYSIDGVSASISKEATPFDDTADQLKIQAEECGSQHKDGYFDELVTMFSGTTMLKYEFRYGGDSQSPKAFTVTLIPNKASYISLDQFKHDWDACRAGYTLYPAMLNTDWLLFENSCGSGYDNGSGLPSGCAEVKKVVEPTLELK